MLLVLWFLFYVEAHFVSRFRYFTSCPPVFSASVITCSAQCVTPVSICLPSLRLYSLCLPLWFPSFLWEFSDPFKHFWPFLFAWQFGHLCCVPASAMIEGLFLNRHPVCILSQNLAQCLIQSHHFLSSQSEWAYTRLVPVRGHLTKICYFEFRK